MKPVPAMVRDIRGMTMEKVHADKWDGKRAAWLWTDCGEGELLPVRYIRADWWIVTGTGWMTNSWCCCSDTTLYIGTPEEAKGQANILRDRLKANRERWASQERATRRASDSQLATHA